MLNNEASAGLPGSTTCHDPESNERFAVNWSAIDVTAPMMIPKMMLIGMTTPYFPTRFSLAGTAILFV
jgi:hypothetical protein